ncbi:hypothetical protein BT69DRAFT_1028459 [Atractiella rhizophila]|nr:hypothetical protein BT69DRAFT_1028459 [Atractiella rhizophila]
MGIFSSFKRASSPTPAASYPSHVRAQRLNLRSPNAIVPVIKLACGDLFHETCLWARLSESGQDAVCPTCNMPLTMDSVPFNLQLKAGGSKAPVASSSRQPYPSAQSNGVSSSQLASRLNSLASSAQTQNQTQNQPPAQHQRGSSWGARPRADSTSAIGSNPSLTRSASSSGGWFSSTRSNSTSTTMNRGSNWGRPAYGTQSASSISPTKSASSSSSYTVSPTHQYFSTPASITSSSRTTPPSALSSSRTTPPSAGKGVSPPLSGNFLSRSRSSSTGASGASTARYPYSNVPVVPSRAPSPPSGSRTSTASASANSSGGQVTPTQVDMIVSRIASMRTQEPIAPPSAAVAAAGSLFAKQQQQKHQQHLKQAAALDQLRPYANVPLPNGASPPSSSSMNSKVQSGRSRTGAPIVMSGKPGGQSKSLFSRLSDAAKLEEAAAGARGEVREEEESLSPFQLQLPRNGSARYATTAQGVGMGMSARNKRSTSPQKVVNMGGYEFNEPAKNEMVFEDYPAWQEPSSYEDSQPQSHSHSHSRSHSRSTTMRSDYESVDPAPYGSRGRNGRESEEEDPAKVAREVAEKRRRYFEMMQKKQASRNTSPTKSGHTTPKSGSTTPEQYDAGEGTDERECDAGEEQNDTFEAPVVPSERSPADGDPLTGDLVLQVEG